MKNGIQKRVRVYFEDLGNGIDRERLFRALSLILSEENVMEYLSASQHIEEHSDFNGCGKESEVLAEDLVKS
jgi:hypothetical protein